MSVTQRILTSWRSPRKVMRAMLAEGKRDDRALVILMAACLLIFVAQWPGLSRAAHMDPDIPLEGRMSGVLMGTVFLVPLFAYAFAAISHLICKPFGGKGSFYSSRLALFWALLVVAPLMLLQGLVQGFIGEGPAAKLMSFVVMVAFLYQWINALIVAEGPDGAA